MNVQEALQGIKGDQLTIIAVLTEKLPKEDLQRIKRPWKRVCDRLNTLEENQERRSKIMKMLQEALSQLRLDLKYLQFDLEATRRERDALKGKLGDS